MIKYLLPLLLLVCSSKADPIWDAAQTNKFPSGSAVYVVIQDSQLRLVTFANLKMIMLDTVKNHHYTVGRVDSLFSTVTSKEKSDSADIKAKILSDSIALAWGKDPGWTAAIGTASKAAFNADGTPVIGGVVVLGITLPVQSDVQSFRTYVISMSQRIKAIEDAARAGKKPGP